MFFFSIFIISNTALNNALEWKYADGVSALQVTHIPDGWNELELLIGVGSYRTSLKLSKCTVPISYDQTTFATSLRYYDSKGFHQFEIGFRICTTQMYVAYCILDEANITDYGCWLYYR